MTDSAILREHAATWQAEGWALIDGLIPRDEIHAALDEVKTAQAKMPASSSGPERRADLHANGGAQFRSAQFDGTTLFPLPDAPRLNRLFVHPMLTSFARLALADDDIRLYQSRVWSKYGGHTNYEQPLHRDGNHSLIPIRNEPGWWHLECFLYLSDVDETNGAPLVAPNKRTSRRLGSGSPLDPHEAADVYATELPAVAQAGSLLAYRSDTWHRGANLAPGTERHVAVIAFRPASVEWIGFDAHAPLVKSPDFVAFAEASTPEELALFGVPLPGHAYWTEQVLDTMASVYPALDLEPWRKAL